MKKLLLILLLPVFCKAQERKIEKWDSAYLQHYVDSAGIIPPNVDLTTLHLGTAIIGYYYNNPQYKLKRY